LFVEELVGLSFVELRCSYMELMEIVIAGETLLKYVQRLQSLTDVSSLEDRISKRLRVRLVVRCGSSQCVI
jgi:hypothetical protein